MSNESSYLTDQSTYAFRMASSKYYSEDIPVFGLKKYDPRSKGGDQFSRKQAWFYTYGDSEIKEEFVSGIKGLVENLFEKDSVDWDFFTLYPTHSKNEVNSNMKELVLESAKEKNISYNQVFRRNKTVSESHEINSMKDKILNLEGSVDVDNSVEGKNIIIVDNISLSGASVLHGGNRLIQEGANNVAAICLGINKYNIDIAKINGLTASELLKEEN